MPRTRIRRAAEVALAAPPDRFVVVRFGRRPSVAWLDVFAEGGDFSPRPWRERVRSFPKALDAFRFAEAMAATQRCKTWLSGLPARAEATQTPGPRPRRG